MLRASGPPDEIAMLLCCEPEARPPHAHFLNPKVYRRHFSLSANITVMFCHLKYITVSGANKRFILKYGWFG